MTSLAGMIIEVASSCTVSRSGISIVSSVARGRGCEPTRPSSCAAALSRAAAPSRDPSSQPPCPRDCERGRPDARRSTASGASVGRARRRGGPARTRAGRQADGTDRCRPAGAAAASVEARAAPRGGVRAALPPWPGMTSTGARRHAGTAREGRSAGPARPRLRLRAAAAPGADDRGLARRDRPQLRDRARSRLRRRRPRDGAAVARASRAVRRAAGSAACDTSARRRGRGAGATGARRVTGVGPADAAGGRFRRPRWLRQRLAAALGGRSGLGALRRFGGAAGLGFSRRCAPDRRSGPATTLS